MVIQQVRGRNSFKSAPLAQLRLLTPSLDASTTFPADSGDASPPARPQAWDSGAVAGFLSEEAGAPGGGRDGREGEGRATRGIGSLPQCRNQTLLERAALTRRPSALPPPPKSRLER